MTDKARTLPQFNFDDASVEKLLKQAFSEHARKAETGRVTAVNFDQKEKHGEVLITVETTYTFTTIFSVNQAAGLLQRMPYNFGEDNSLYGDFEFIR